MMIITIKEKENTERVLEELRSGKTAIVQINTANLVSDLKYQRAIDKRKVFKIIENFDIHRFGIIKVSFRDGKNYVFDGQHRLMVLKMINNGQDCIIPCELHFNLTYENEAKLFAEQYLGSTRVDVVYQNRALYESGDKILIGLKNLVEKTGLELPLSKGKGDNKIIAISKLKKIYIDLKDDEFLRMLKLLKQTWKGVSTSLDVEILGGLYLFFKIYKNELNDVVFVRNLQKVEPVVIKRVGKADYSARGDLKYAKVIWDYYNKNLIKNKLLYKFNG